MRQVQRTNDLDDHDDQVESDQQTESTNSTVTAVEDDLAVLEDELELPQRTDLTYSTVDGIELENGFGYIPNESEIQIPIDQLENAKLMHASAINRADLDVHPLALLYHIESSDKLISSDKHLKNCTVDVDHWVQNIYQVMTSVREKGSFKLVIELRSRTFTVTSE